MIKGAQNKKNTEEDVKNKGGRNVIPTWHYLYFLYFWELFLFKDLLKTKTLKVTLAQQTIIYIYKSKWHLENSATRGDITMQQENMF